LVEVREELTFKRAEMAAIFEEAGPELDMSRITRLGGDNAAKVAEIQRRRAELDALGAEFDRLTLMDMVRTENAREMGRLVDPVGPPVHAGGNGNGGGYQPRRTLKAVLEDSKPYRAFRTGREGTSFSIDLPYPDFKTLVTLANVSAQADRRDPVEMALESRTIADLLDSGNTVANSIEYYEETTFTNAAATVAEGVAKPESTDQFTLRTETVRKIATNIPATKESVDDVGWLMSQLQGRMAFGVRRQEENQILNGDNTGTNLNGLLNRTIQSTAKGGAEDNLTAIYRGMQLVRGSAGSGFAEPTAIVMNPANWTAIATLRTADGIYIWGHPSGNGPETVWGLPLRQTTALAAGTALILSRPWAQVMRREDVGVTVSTEHSTFFTENKIMIQAESRLTLCVYRPSAFAKVTALT
jgi:hypothetical protein